MTDYIYVVFVKTSTFVGKTVRLTTQSGYNHVSIALNEELNTLYSFSRYVKMNPLLGGFVEESPLRFLDRNKDIEVLVYKLPIDIKEKIKMQKTLEMMLKHQRIFRYNILEAISYLLPTKPIKLAKGYTCLSFITKLLVVHKLIKQPKYINKFSQLQKILKHKAVDIYEHSYKLQDKKKYTWGKDTWLK